MSAWSAQGRTDPASIRRNAIPDTHETDTKLVNGRQPLPTTSLHPSALHPDTPGPDSDYKPPATGKPEPLRTSASGRKTMNNILRGATLGLALTLIPALALALAPAALAASKPRPPATPLPQPSASTPAPSTSLPPLA
jgi:hypothetical protein